MPKQSLGEKLLYNYCVISSRNLEHRSGSVSSSHSRASHKKSPRGNSSSKGSPSKIATYGYQLSSNPHRTQGMIAPPGPSRSSRCWRWPGRQVGWEPGYCSHSRRSPSIIAQWVWILIDYDKQCLLNIMTMESVGTNRQKDKQTNRQTDKKTKRQKDRKTKN